MFIHEEEKPSLLIPISISLIIHALMVMTAVMLPAELPTKPKETIIEVWPTPQEMDKVQQKMPLRIADIDPPAVQKRPKKAKFVGLYDSSVDEETVSASRKGKGGGKGTGKGTGKGKGRRQAKKPQAKKSSRDKLYGFDENLFAMREPIAKEQPTRRSPTDVGRISIGGSSGDFFPDVKVGQHTYLNVLRYPEISYFVRLKRVFRMTFDPGPPLRSYFSTNRVARGSVEVVLAVGVNETGKLSELFVLRGSGISSYDREAMRTIRASSPFSAPPEKFLAADGQLRMMWTFTVYL
jgi:TonB family protein